MALYLVCITQEHQRRADGGCLAVVDAADAEAARVAASAAVPPGGGTCQGWKVVELPSAVPVVALGHFKAAGGLGGFRGA